MMALFVGGPMDGDLREIRPAREYTCVENTSLLGVPVRSVIEIAHAPELRLHRYTDCDLCERPRLFIHQSLDAARALELLIKNYSPEKHDAVEKSG